MNEKISLENGALSAEEMQLNAAQFETPRTPEEERRLERMQATLQRTIDASPAYDEEHAAVYTDKSFVDYDEEVEPQHFLLREGATEFFPKGELIVVSGKLKHGKTHWCEELALSLLGHSRFGYEATKPDCRILWIDTEQSRYDASRLNDSVREAANIDKSLKRSKRPFVLHSFRGFTVEERLRRIEAYLSRRTFDVLVVDGVADLLVNYNDVNESQNLIMNQLLRWCADYGCAVVCVMHENKSADDSALKGHLGTLLGQKLAEQYSVKRAKKDGEDDEYYFTMEMSECRSGRKVVKRTIEFDENGRFAPSRYEKPSSPPKSKKEPRVNPTAVCQVLRENGDRGMSSTEIYDALLIEKATSTDKANLSQMVEDGYIRFEGAGYNRRYYLGDKA